MAYSIIAESKEAGNGSYATIYTTPAGATAVIRNIVAYNTTGGGLAVTIAIKRDGVDQIQALETVATLANNAFGGQIKSCVPITLRSGDLLEAQAGGTGVFITVSGLKLS